MHPCKMKEEEGCPERGLGVEEGPPSVEIPREPQSDVRVGAGLQGTVPCTWQNDR